MTCLVGKNEAGKSGLLEALELFNPAQGGEFNLQDQYPRWLVVKDRKSGDLSEHAPISVQLELEKDDVDAVEAVLGSNVLLPQAITVQRRYSGGTLWSIETSEKHALTNLVSCFSEPLAATLAGAADLAELRSILEAIETETDGSPTKEDVATAKKALADRGLEKHTVWQRTVGILTPRLPQFFRFTNYHTLPGRIDFNKLSMDQDDGPARSALQTARALLRLAGTDPSELSKDDYELRRSELEAVQIDLTHQVFEYWTQNPDLEVLIDVDKDEVRNANGTTAVSRYLDIRLKDRRTGYSNNFRQRSSGFQWFFSFLAGFTEFESKRAPVVLLDEPALTLHGKAQADFLRFINERVALSSMVVYTTHSPFMVEGDRLERVRIVEDHGPPRGATASDEVLAADPDTLFPLQAALGYDIAQNLFVGPHNLVVEGTSDFIYITLLSRLCAASGRTALDDRWRIVPAGGATNIPTFVSLVGPHLDITVLADADTRGMQRVTGMIEQKLLKGHRLVLASSVADSKNADIEDLFSEGDYLKLYNKTFSTSLKVAGLPEGDRIVKRIERLTGSAFDHGRVAEALLRNPDVDLTEKTLDRFAALNARLNATLGS